MTDIASIDGPDTLPQWHMPWPSLTPDWPRSALLLVDLQNYACNRDVGVARMLLDDHPGIAEYYVPRITELVVPNSSRLIEAFRRWARPVLYTRHGPLLEDGRDMIGRRRRRDLDSARDFGAPTLWHRGTFEHQILDALAPNEDELVIDKNTASAFNSTGIEWMLRNLDVKTLVIAGMATDMCVETTARDAADRGFDVILVEDATATFFAHHHYAALSSFARVFGVVWSTARVIDALGVAAPLPPT
jgi:nicotinamidase-related amidase